MRMGRIAVLVVFVAAACGDNRKAGQDAGSDTGGPACGNGVVDGTEQCDDGPDNGGPQARCTSTCTWVCIEDSWCTDTEPCNGAETCVDHRCVQGSNEADGTSCGGTKLCRNGACTDAVCGDMFTTPPSEECDDGNSTLGDGCENNCKFSCVSTDSARNCTPVDPCQGQGTCNDTTHVCAPGTPLADNTSCGNGKYCKTGVCTTAMCGNGMTEPGEDCDLGAQNGTTGSGCKANCTFECVNPANDCPAAPMCQKETCSASHACAAVADTAKNGMSCGNNLVCNNGACVAPTAVCGNGTIETGEQCDFGTGNGAGTGCETNCQFSCTIIPDSCNDGNACNGTETCTMVTVSGHAGQKCTATAAPMQGTSCGTGKICLGQLCVTSTCGDGYTDAGAGEQCDPPNNTTCSATCKNIVCGDGVRAGNEQCDDGNTTNLDGCDSACKFEQCHRVNSLAMSFNTDTYCTANALGGAIGSLAQGQLGTALTDGVTNGSITIELLALGLADLSGTNGTFSLGILTGTPVTGTNYNGTMDLDWWYTTGSTVIDASRVPTTQTAATITAKTLNAGPSDITISISLGGSPATLDMLAAKMRGNIGASSTPTTSTGSTPGHLASEHLNPALTSFATMTGGQLCGNVTAGSLAQVPVPMALLSNCTQYTAANSLLDVIVGGCTVVIVQVIKPTQPDKVRAGSVGGPFKFSTDAAHKVNGCKNAANQTVPLANCLNDAAYSSSFKFTTDRVIAK